MCQDMRKQNITEVTDFSQKIWLDLIDETIKFSRNKNRRPRKLKRKRVGLLFDSNSLRTRLSFETATYLLGGDSYFIDIHNLTHEKDGAKRESFEDIVDTMDKMVDCYVLRDYTRALYDVFLRKTDPPFINGFCYRGHPSQALADLAVITKTKGTWKNLVYAAVGPATGSGVIESFIYGVLLLGQKITIITPTGTFSGKNPDFNDQVKTLEKKYGGSFSVTKKIHETIENADVLYVDEWWENNKNFLAKKMGKYQVNEKFLADSKPSLSILHCLPAHPGREITADTMRSSQSIIFNQAEFRVYSAMALLSFLADE